MRRAIGTLALLATLVLGGCTLLPQGTPSGGSSSGSPSSGAAVSGSALQVSPHGTGSCGASSPCSLQTALDKAGPGSTIALAGGDYGDVTLKNGAHLAGAKSNVTVRPAGSAVPSFGRLTSEVPHVTWEGVRVTVVWYLNPPASGSRLEKVHLDGGGLFLRTSDATVAHSLFEKGSSIDGIQVGGAKNALIEDNTVRDYNQLRNNGLHADCIQVFDSTDVTIRGNRLSNCYNSGLIVSVGRGTGTDGLTVESNFIQGCIQKTPECGGGSTTDLREPTAKNLTIVNNTLVNGSVRVAEQPGLVFDRNIVQYVSTCDAPMTNSIVLSWNTRMCKTPSMIGTDGNRTGQVAFVDQDGGDLRPTDPSSVTITPTGDTKPAAKGIDGKPLPATIAGAAG
jgi:hypothetical protein